MRLSLVTLPLLAVPLLAACTPTQQPVASAAATDFLARFADGWRVIAAGCRSRGEDLPYDCAVRS